MTFFNRLAVSFAALCIAATSSFAANVVQYRVTVLREKTGKHFIEARALNNLGDVAGISITKTTPGETPKWRGFLYKGGKFIDLGVLPGCGFSEARALNDHDQVVGESQATGDVSKAFIWQNGKMKRLPLGGLGESEALAINNAGVVVGSAASGDSVVAAVWQRGAAGVPVLLPAYNRAVAVSSSGDVVTSVSDQSFVVNGKKTLRIGTLGGTDSLAQGFNDQGEIVGTSTTRTELTHAFLWNRGAMTDVSTSPAKEDKTAAVLGAYSVNDLGVIVGTLRAGEDTRAGIVEAGGAWNLNHQIPPHTIELDIARAINDRGQIIGQGRIGKNYVSFLLTPINPLPKSPAPVSVFSVAPSTTQPSGPLPGSAPQGGIVTHIPGGAE